MTDEDRDRLEGRVNRELREAEAALNALLVKAAQVAKEITELANEITNRIGRARFAGTAVAQPLGTAGDFRKYVEHDAGIETGRLKRYERAVDLAAIDALDREIGQAVANLLKARQQKDQLGV